VFGFGPATRIYVAAGATDMRKNFNGLYGLVRDHPGCDPESGHVFLFANSRRNRLKLFRMSRGREGPAHSWVDSKGYCKPTPMLPMIAGSAESTSCTPAAGRMR
jgi:IS66 Orf2 like protein